MPIRIVIADDHPVVRRGLSQFIADDPGLEIVAECADGEQALAAVTQHQPDVLIVDLRMPHVGGLNVLRGLRDAHQAVAVIVLAGNIADDEVMEAMRLGAKGVVLKEMAPSLLLQCIRKVAAGGTWLEKEAVGRTLERILQNQDSRDRARELLTPR